MLDRNELKEIAEMRDEDATYVPPPPNKGFSPFYS